MTEGLDTAQAPQQPAVKVPAEKKSAAKKAPAKKVAAKKAPAKKAVAKKAAAKKAVAKKAVAKKAAAKKAVAKKAVARVRLPAAQHVSAERPAGSLDDFVEFVLGSAPELTSRQVAQLAGVSEEVTRALWRAMGFADVGGEAEFAMADVEALRALMALVDAGYVSYEESIELVRAIGQHTSRLAEWQGNIIARSLIERGVIAQHGVLEADDIGALLADSRAYKPVLEELMLYSWRRQMSHNAARAAAIAEVGPEARTDSMTVGFADLAGFTRLSRQIPEEDLAVLVQSFESVSADVVAAEGARLIKTLGDEVLFVHESPRKIAAIAVELHEAHRGNHDVPKMRIGLATGPVLLRMGDVFGTTVNRASRLTAMAKPGSTYVDSATLDELEHLEQFSFKGVRPRPARGFGLLRAWSMAAASTS
jgi:adenylate cyclase